MKLWLASIGMQEYADMFEKFKVNGPVLMSITRQDLREFLLMVSEAHLEYFMQRVEQVR